MQQRQVQRDQNPENKKIEPYNRPVLTLFHPKINPKIASRAACLCLWSASCARLRFLRFLHSTANRCNDFFCTLTSASVSSMSRGTFGAYFLPETVNRVIQLTHYCCLNCSIQAVTLPFLAEICKRTL